MFRVDRSECLFVKAAVFRNMVGTRVNLSDKAKTNY